ncbi:PAS domain-containing sensor histidine kinase [Paenibacillus hexagrammi]|uniref:histidine kinase n=1 Tax=Paenibacillus hexagrammi TaxID=2908839 RepID=A0ABY3SLM3_9BACL|nr:PAS domain-containing sensor histidine kinase [Paenibacillus sp. YPD9-1]UJF34086.1 PAS domain S-box protein [Paenibacillus sp. YPD9-1]
MPKRLKLNEILDRITDAFFAVDNSWTFIYMNREAGRVLSCETENVIGKNIWDEFPEAVELPFFEHYNKAMHEQVTVEFEAYFPPLSRWFEVKAYPITDGLTVYFRDITEKKMAWMQIDQHYESLFKYNPDAVFSFDLKGNYMSVNPAMERLLGYTEEELLQMSFLPLIPPNELAMTVEHFSEAAKGNTQHYETKAMHKNGTVVDVKVTNMPIIVHDTAVGVYGVARDITEENKNKIRLLDSEKLTAVGQLAASIAHEIRNPLTSLKGFLQLIENTMPGIKKEYFTIMTDELTRIEMITSELLVLAKPQAQEFKCEDIGKIINDVIMLLGPQALINNVEFDVTDIHALPQVSCINTQLKQAFINLIKNAIEAMPQGGKIRIAARKVSEEQIEIQIIDEGHGIPKAFLKQIGSPFYTTKEKGTGLGMMTTFKIIQSHGGLLNVSSEERKGTTVLIHLPIHPTTKQEKNE